MDGNKHSGYNMTNWRSQIAVYSTRLESARAQAHVGSNPTSSALRQAQDVGFEIAEAKRVGGMRSLY